MLYHQKQTDYLPSQHLRESKLVLSYINLGEEREAISTQLLPQLGFIHMVDLCVSISVYIKT